MPLIFVPYWNPFVLQETLSKNVFLKLCEVPQFLNINQPFLLCHMHDVANSSGESRKSKNLKEATQHLKEEALRRFQINHKASLENHEKTVKEELEAVQGLSSPAKDESNNIESKAEEIGDTEEASVETKRPDEDIEKEGVSGGFENTVDSGDDLADKNVSADGICPDSDVETPSDNVKDREVGEQEDNLEINSNRAEHTGQDLPEGETIVPAEDSIENTLSSSKPTG